MKATAKQNALADEIACQEASPNKALVLTIQAAVRQRVRHDAVAGVLAMCERIARAALDKPEPSTDESDMQPEDRKLLRYMR